MMSNCLKKLLLLIVCIVLNQGCAYRFSHLQKLKYPFKTIAVEAVYDTSSEVLPHEMMWEEMQKAFARDGRLLLTSPQKADALITMHLKSSQLNAAGTVVDQDRSAGNESIRIDRKLFNGKEPPIAQNLKKITTAGEVSDRLSLAVQVEVKIWDLSDRKVVLSRDYNLSEIYLSEDNVGDQMNEFLNHEEKFSSDFKRISQNLASRVVQDFFISY